VSHPEEETLGPAIKWGGDGNSARGQKNGFPFYGGNYHTQVYSSWLCKIWVPRLGGKNGVSRFFIFLTDKVVNILYLLFLSSVFVNIP